MNRLKKILILDDDEISTYLTKKIAEKSNLVEESQIFYQSEEALSYLRTAIIEQTALPDLIVLDINMPVLDGWDFINELQKTPNYKPIPIVVLSSSVYKADQDKSKTYPEIKGYLIKPLILAEFEKILRQAFSF